MHLEHRGPLAELPKRGRHRLLAGGRDERQRVLIGLGIRLVDVQPVTRMLDERGRIQINLVVGGSREDVHELHRHTAVRRLDDALLHQVGPSPFGKRPATRK